MSTFIQRSFAGGEITPALYARTDQTKYSYGLRTLRNMYVMRHGGATNRPGTSFVSEVQDSSKKTLIKPFVFNNEDTYVMEFGEKYIRFSQGGKVLQKSGAPIQNISTANPAVITLGELATSSPVDLIAYDAISVQPTGARRWGQTRTRNATGAPVLRDLQPFTPVENGDLKSIEHYVGVSNRAIPSGTTARLNIYRSTPAGQPSLLSLYTQSAVTDISTSGPGFEIKAFSFPNIPLNAGEKYWIGYPDTSPAYDPNDSTTAYYHMQVSATSIGGINSSYERSHTFQNSSDRYEPGLSFSSAKVIYEGIEVNTSGIINETEITISGLPDFPEINGQTFRINKVGDNQFEMFNLDGTPFDGSSISYTSGGQFNATSITESPYLESELCDLQINQSADVVIITHPNHPPLELKRVGVDEFTLSELNLEPTIDPPSGLAIQLSATGSVRVTYLVTAISSGNFEESYPSQQVTKLVAEPTDASPVVLEWAIDDRAIEYNIYKEQNGAFGLVGVSRSGEFRDVGVSPDFQNTPPDPRIPFDDSSTSITDISPDPSPFNDGLVVSYSGEASYKIGQTVRFRDVQGMTQINSGSYIVSNVDPTAKTVTLQDFDRTGFGTYTDGGTLFVSGNYPSTSTFYQQRLMFANTINNVESVWGSQTGRFRNFAASSVLKPDDGLSFTMAGRQINEIRHLVDLGRLIVFTSSGEWTIEGDEAGVLTPTSINPRRHSYNGANNMQPIVINGSAIYVQARGSIVRDLSFDFQVDGYRGNDLTLFSSHLVDDYNLVEWAYQQVPHSILWIVRDDGVLLSLTYIREQQVLGWARHDFHEGFVESVTVVPEGDEDAVYVVVRREINGQKKRYVERMNSRNVIDITDNIFMDSTVTVDGRNSGSNKVTLSGGTDWVYSEEINLSSSEDLFSASDVGNQVNIRYKVKKAKDVPDEITFDYNGDEEIRLEILSYIDARNVTVRSNRTVPVELRNIGIGSFGKAIKTVFGLSHLEGQKVSIFADRFAVASPFNESFQEYTVLDGKVTLDKPHVVIHVGLPYISDMETLDMDTNNAETMMDKAKNPTHASVYVEESRGIFVGIQKPENDCVNPLENLQELQIRDNEGYDDPVDLLTGIAEVNLVSRWNNNGRVFLRQVDPIPMTVLAIAPSGYFVVR